MDTSPFLRLENAMKLISSLLSGRSLLTLTAQATAFEAAQAMERAHVGCVLILDDQDAPLGIFTERDLMTRVVVTGADPKKVRLAKVMTKELFTASPDEPVNTVARAMQARHIRHLPVVEDGALRGILSLRDVLRAHLDAKRQEVQDLTAYIQGEADQ